MSQLIDKLNRISEGAPQPMGFRAAQLASPKLRMLLVASLSELKTNNLADYVAGADGVLLSVSPSSAAKALREASQAVPDIPWGAWLGDSGQTEIDEIVKAGCDFVVFAEANTPLVIPTGNAVGRILEVEASLSDGLLRAVDDLLVDAVLTTGEPKEDWPLTWRHLMFFQRFANLLTKPFLVSIPSSVTASELEALCQTGVDGVIIKVETGQPPGRIGELHRAIDKLASPPQRKRGKAEPLLPHIRPEPETLSEEEEEEE